MVKKKTENHMDEVVRKDLISLHLSESVTLNGVKWKNWIHVDNPTSLG